MISISTPGPSWAAGRALDRPGLRKPSPRQFGLFAGAVAERYAPYVDHYGISNEPNQPGWLMPQSDGDGLFAPHHYREMVQAAYPRIKDADAESVVLIGELASTGRVGTGRRQGHPAARLPARHGVRQPPLPAGPERALPQLRAGARSTPSATTPTRCSPPPPGAPAPATTPRSATAGACCGCSTG